MNRRGARNMEKAIIFILPTKIFLYHTNRDTINQRIGVIIPNLGLMNQKPPELQKAYCNRKNARML